MLVYPSQYLLDGNLGSSFDVSMSAITMNMPSAAPNGAGENLGSIFQHELESARTQIEALQVSMLPP